MAKRPHALVIGGSVGGLMAGLMLIRGGWNVTVFERSAGDLSGRGAGLGISEEMMDCMRRVGAPFDASGAAVRDRVRQYQVGEREQFFDLTADPAETRDLAGDASRGPEVREWRTRMTAHLEPRGEAFVKGGRLIPRPERMAYSPNYPKAV